MYWHPKGLPVPPITQAGLDGCWHARARRALGMLVPTQLGLISVDAARQEIYFLYSWSCIINLGLLLLL